jgi:mannose-6-phosphate isomerase-like protein (cupin superfamily)
MADRPGTGLGLVRHLGERWLTEQPFSGELSSVSPEAEEGISGMARSSAYKLDAEQGERLRFSGADFVIKAAGDTTGGAFSIIEEIDPLDTPLHRHTNEDELFYVIAGEHVFRCGDQEFRVGPGGMMFAPRGVPHAHRRVVPRTGRFLTITSPAGFEGFFRELSVAEASGAAMPEAYAAASRKYGIDWL